MVTRHTTGKISKLAEADAQPGDEREGDWPRERLIRMDADFVAAMERAIAAGKERRPDGERPVRAA